MSTKPICILVTEPMADEGIATLKNHPNFTVDVCLNLSKAELFQKIPHYDCLLVRSQTKVDRELIMIGTRLQLIGRAGVGIDNIDIKCAKERGIAVINTPSGNSISTAELAFGLILSLARKIPQAHQHVRDGKWQRTNFKGTELHEKTLGIIGFGNVGRNLSKMAQAFNMRVIAHDPLATEETFLFHQAEGVSIETLFAQADFISLHCVLNDATKNMINEKNLARMKPGAMLVNAARGELIDDDALLAALNGGQIAAAALDVFHHEPPSPDSALLKHPNIVVTPHLGASTEEAQKRVSTLLAEQTVCFFHGKNIARVV